MVTAPDLLAGGALLIYEGKKCFLKSKHISERLCPIQVSNIDDSVFVKLVLFEEKHIAKSC